MVSVSPLASHVSRLTSFSESDGWKTSAERPCRARAFWKATNDRGALVDEVGGMVEKDRRQIPEVPGMDA